jgi:serralysin
LSESFETHDHSDGTHDHPVDFDPSILVPSIDASVDHLAGTFGPNGKPIWSAEQAATYLFRAGAGYGTGGNMVMPTGGDINVLTYGFHTGQASLAANGYVYFVGTSGFGLPEYFNFAPFTDAQKEATREAFQYWDDVVSTEFVESNINDADIAFGNYTNRPGTQAYARLLANTVTADPAINEQIRDIGGDVWVARNTASNFQLDEGGYGMNTLVHEIGHGFGMLHPGDYNASPGVSLSYAANAEYYQDTRSYSILSYWNPRDIKARDFDFTVMSIAYGATPMVHDILSMQMKYGAEMTTRTGDTVYGFNSTAGRDAFDFVKTPAPMMAIWDAGGNDTLDASGYSTNQVINLTPGSLSSIGGITAAEFPTFAQVNANRAAAGMAPVAQATYDGNRNVFMTNPAFYGRLEDNVGIAYGAIIENAVGGSGHDSMIGNAADNRMSGNGGNDIIASGLGDDTLDGGSGNDEMLGGAGDDLYVVGEAGDIVTELAGEGTDTVRSSIGYTLGANVEALVLTGTALHGTGNGLDNSINGNELDNVLDGKSGNDEMTGGLGNDTFIVDDAGDTVVELLNEGTDTVKASINYQLGGNVENLTLTGTAATGSGNALDNTLVGNASSNHLSGGLGNDRLIGGDMTDYLSGGAGDDVFVAEINAHGAVTTKSGSKISLDVVVDFTSGDLIDLRGIDANISVEGLQAFTWIGTNANKAAGQLSMKQYESVQGAEKALGYDIDGVDGTSPYGGPVTVVYGNIDGGDPDFAIVLMGTPGVGTGGFIFS